MAYPFNTVHNDGNHLDFSQRPTRPAPPTPNRPIAGPEVQKLIKRLIENTNFDHYHLIINDYLMTNDKTWEVIQFLRTDTSDIWDKHHRSTTQIPPPDIFNIISELRNSATWCPQEKHEVLMRVRTRRQPQSYLTVNRSRPHLQSSTSTSRLTQLRTTSNALSYDGSRSDDHSLVAESPYNDGASVAADIRKKAPEGWRFHCPSRNCKSTYSRQGDYENHMHQKHAEFPAHDPQTSLKRISQIPKMAPLHTDGLAPAIIENDHTPNNAYSTSIQANAPMFPFPAPTIPLSPDDVLTDVLEAGAGPGRLNPQDIHDPTRLTISDPTDYLLNNYLSIYEGRPMFHDVNNLGYPPQSHAEYDNDVRMI